MAADTAMSALNSLLRTANIEDHDEALRAAHSAMQAFKDRSNPDALKAQLAGVVALLKLDRFDHALRAIAAGGDVLEQQCVPEKAYALYKTGKLEEAGKVLGEREGRGARHLAAQIAYRSEDFDKAARIYEELYEEGGSEVRYGEENDVRINFLAACAQLEWQGKGKAVPAARKQPGREELEAFETAYNAACGCLGRGDYGKAGVLLKRARDLCEASEDLGEEEKKTELVPIVLQQAYCFTKMGKMEEAKRVQAGVLLADIPDAATKTVAISNAAAQTVESNPFLAQRIASQTPKDIPSNDRLFEYQASILKRNKYVIELLAQKFRGVERSIGKVLKDESETASISLQHAHLGVIRAAASCESRMGKEALHALSRKRQSCPDDVGLVLTIVQLYLQLANPCAAITLLESFFARLESADQVDVRFAPGLIAVVVALYRLQGRHSAIRAELARAAAHWENKQQGSTDPASLLCEAGIELLHSANPDDVATAGRVFERLVHDYPEDRSVVAGFVASFAVSDFAKVEPHLDTLTPVEDLIKDVDVSQLMSAGVAVVPTIAHVAGKKRAFDSDQKPAGRQRKKRKTKLPKNYVECTKPDPERWLPLRDRSSYRPKGKKGKKRVAAAMQGGPVKEGVGETVELAGGAGSVRMERAAAAGGGGGGGGGGGAGKKKKNKGRK